MNTNAIVENACIDLIKDYEEVIFVTVNTQKKTSKCIGSQIGMNFINRDISIAEKNTNFLELFHQFVKDNYNITDLSIATEQKTIIRQDESQHTSSNAIDLIGSNHLDFSQSMIGDSVHDNILDSIITNENDLLTSFSQTDDRTSCEGQSVVNPASNENELKTKCMEQEITVKSHLFDDLTKNKQFLSENKERRGEEAVILNQTGADREGKSKQETSKNYNLCNTDLDTLGKETSAEPIKQTEYQEVSEKETSTNQTDPVSKVFDLSTDEQKKGTSNNQKDSSGNETGSVKEKQETSKNEKEATSNSVAPVSKMNPHRKVGRPKKDSSKEKIMLQMKDKSNSLTNTKETKIEEKVAKQGSNSSSKSKTPNSLQPPAAKVSRSGRKVVMPKWRLEDQWEVKDIKTEPDDDEEFDPSAMTPVRDKLFSNSGPLSKVVKIEPGQNLLKKVEKLVTESFKSKQNMKTKGKEEKGDSKIEFPNKNENRKQAKRKCESSLENSGNEKIFKRSSDMNDVSQDTRHSDAKDDGKSVYVKTLEKNDQNDGENDVMEDHDDLLDPLFNPDSLSEDEDTELKEELSDDKGDKKVGKSEKQSNCIWKCGVCNAKAKKCWLVRRHMKRMHDLTDKDLKPCRVCKKVFVYEDCPHELDENSKNFTCIVCQKVFNTKCQLQIHFETHITEKDFPCSLCNKKFKSERHVKMHIYNTHKKRNGRAIAGNAEPGICDICGKWFRFRCNAVRHREIHFEEKRFDCSICNMKFRHSSSLKRHMISHQGKAEYVCEQCGRSFKMKQTLIQHHRVHVKQPFLKCEYCPREFRTYKGKKYHILKDHSEKAVDFNFKSFVCEICGKQSSSQLVHNEHVKNHDKNRTHVCTVCGCRWETAAQLKAHKKSHNYAPYRYRCKVCNIPFKEASKIRLHVTKDSHIRTCISMGLEPTKDKVTDVTNSDIVEITDQDYNFPLQSEEELQQEMQSASNVIEEVQEEIKVIHINPIDYDASDSAHLKILNEEGIEIMYDEINLPQETINVDNEQVIYQVEIDGQNAIICDNLTSQAVESILKLHNQT